MPHPAGQGTILRRNKSLSCQCIIISCLNTIVSHHFHVSKKQQGCQGFTNFHVVGRKKCFKANWTFFFFFFFFLNVVWGGGKKREKNKSLRRSIYNNMRFMSCSALFSWSFLRRKCWEPLWHFHSVEERTQELHHCRKSMHLLNLNGLHLYSGKVKIHVNPLLYASTGTVVQSHRPHGRKHSCFLKKQLQRPRETINW